MRLEKKKGPAFVHGTPNSWGDAHMRPEELEDLWHLFNLISRGDHLRAKTLRKVSKQSSTGTVSSQRVLMLLEIEVQSVDFDPEGGEMRVGGVTVSEHDGMSLGSHHTLELELQREFNLHKKCWDARHLEVLAQATGGAVARADVAAVLMEHGRCNVCLISGGLTVVRAKLEVHIPKKGAATVMQGAAKSTEKFYGQVLRAVLEHVDFAKVKAVLLAGPGFVKEQWWEWAKAEASKKRDHAEHKALLHSVPQWVLCHASSAYKHALKEVLGAPEVAARLSDTKAAAEVVALRRFFEMMADEPDRTTYGLKEVLRARDQGAIDKLLLADSLFRAQHVKRRQQYVELAEAVRDGGGAVHIFSSFHASGEQLAQLSGVAALLRFPMPLLSDDPGDSSDDDDDDEAREGVEALRVEGGGGGKRAEPAHILMPS